jgi:hypothetical protein
MPRELECPLNPTTPSETLAFVQVVFDMRKGEISGLLMGNSRSDSIIFGINSCGWHSRECQFSTTCYRFVTQFFFFLIKITSILFY